jgi:PKD repeat protein
MKTKEILATLFIVGILISACKKTKLPDSEETNTEFYIACNYNGLPLKIEAGVSDYYMNASYYYDSTSNVYAYKATLSQAACANCNYAVSILINDASTSTNNAAMNVKDALRLGKYIFNDDKLPPLFYTVNFTPEKNQESGSTYNWALNGVLFNNTYQLKDMILDANSTANVSLNYANATGDCGTLHANNFKINANIQSTIKAIKDDLQAPFKYKFSNTTISNSPLISYLWNFGDQTISTESNPVHIFKSFGNKVVTLRTINATNDTCITSYQIDVTEGNSSCDANFVSSFIPLKNTKAYSAITILFTDANGKTFSSKDFSQPDNSNFEITEVSDYIENAKQQRTKKLKIKFNCEIKNGNEIVKITNGEAVIAVAYK